MKRRNMTRAHFEALVHLGLGRGRLVEPRLLRALARAGLARIETDPLSQTKRYITRIGLELAHAFKEFGWPACRTRDAKLVADMRLREEKT